MHAILSLDLGIKNIGYAIVSYSKFGKLSFADLNIKFGIYDISENIPKGCNIVNGRCSALHSFFNNIIESYSIDFIIIERQVSRNTMAMELMYATTAISLFHCSDVIIFDPKNKFTKLNIGYDTNNKKHKKQSITYARNLINTAFTDKLNEFENHSKKDDISDALNQCFVWMLENEFLKITKDEFVSIITSQ